VSSYSNRIKTVSSAQGATQPAEEAKALQALWDTPLDEVPYVPTFDHSDFLPKEIEDNEEYHGEFGNKLNYPNSWYYDYRDITGKPAGADDENKKDIKKPYEQFDKKELSKPPTFEEFEELLQRESEAR